MARTNNGRFLITEPGSAAAPITLLVSWSLEVKKSLRSAYTSSYVAKL